MSDNYREYGYDLESQKTLSQIQEDYKEAKEIEERAKELNDERKEEIAKEVLFKKEVLADEVEKVMNNYAFN